MEEFKPRDYTLERWIAVILWLLFFVPFVVRAEEPQPLPTTTFNQVEDDPGAVRKEVVAVALRHHLVSQYTSLVTVDRTPQGLAGAACKPEFVPTNHQGGGEALGSLPQTATPARVSILASLALVAAGLVLMRKLS